MNPSTLGLICTPIFTLRFASVFATFKVNSAAVFALLLQNDAEFCSGIMFIPSFKKIC